MSADEPQGDEFEVQRRHPYATIPDALITDLAVKELGVRVFCLIDRYVGTRAGAWPSRATLAKRLSKSERTIDTALANLCATGWLEVKPRRRRDGSRASSLYILSDSPEAAAAVRVTNAASKAKRDAKAAQRQAQQASNAQDSARCQPQDSAVSNAQDSANNNAQDSAGHERTPEGTSPTSSPSAPQAETAGATAAPSGENQNASVIDLRDGDRRRRGPQTIDTTANRSDVQAICDHLADAVGRYARRRPEVTHSWRDAARKLIDVDKADPAEIHAVIEWATADRMWRSNIINAVKLRQHYDTLWIKAKQAAEEARQPVRQNGRPTPIQSAMAIDDLGQRMAEEDARRAALAGNDQFEVTA